MKILVIFTGGTIGSSVSGNIISADESSTYLLLDLFRRKTGKIINFDTAEPYYALSENNTGLELTRLATAVGEALKKDYDGVIVTHGTDTLQYSAAALSCALGTNTIPIVLVSSNYVLTDERANGLDNFINAVRFIEHKCGRGVFVSYKNTGDIPRIHRASRLLAHDELDDAVYSVKNQFYGSFENEKFVKNNNYTAKNDEVEPFGALCFDNASEEIAVLQPYVGFKYQAVGKAVKAVIIKAYHSGTLCTDNEDFKAFANDLKERKIPCFLCGAESKTIYESAAEFADFGIKILPPTSFISQYIKLWCALQSGANPNEIMFSSLGEDIV